MRHVLLVTKRRFFLTKWVYLHRSLQCLNGRNLTFGVAPKDFVEAIEAMS